VAEWPCCHDPLRFSPCRFDSSPHPILFKVQMSLPQGFRATTPREDFLPGAALRALGHVFGWNWMMRVASIEATSHGARGPSHAQDQVPVLVARASLNPESRCPGPESRPGPGPSLARTSGLSRATVAVYHESRCPWLESRPGPGPSLARTSGLSRATVPSTRATPRTRSQSG